MKDITVSVVEDGHGMILDIVNRSIFLTANEAYTLHQLIGARLSELVQPLTNLYKKTP